MPFGQPFAFLDRCIWRATSAGDVDFVVASAVAGFEVPDTCLAPAVVDDAPYIYFAQSNDRTEWEKGYGPYDVQTGTLARTVVLDSSSGGAIVAFLAAPVVFMGAALGLYWPFSGKALSGETGDSINIEGGEGTVNSGGKVTIQPGAGATDGGDFIVNLPAAGSGRQGLFFFGNVPTSDPAVVDTVWRDNGVLVFSGSTGGAKGPVSLTAVAGAFDLSGVNFATTSELLLTTDGSSGPSTLNYSGKGISGQVLPATIVDLAGVGDTVVILNAQVNGNLANIVLGAVNTYGTVEFINDQNRMVFDYSDSDTTIPFADYGLGTFSGVRFNTVSQAALSYLLADADQIILVTPSTLLNTNAGGTTVNIVVKGVADWDNVPHTSLITYSTGTGGDAIAIDPANFLTLAGATPSAITMVPGDTLSVITASGANWLILGATPGVVT